MTLTNDFGRMRGTPEVHRCKVDLSVPVRHFLEAGLANSDLLPNQS